MQLPFLKTLSKPLSQTGIFNGIGSDKLFDTVNLICNERCHTRKPRQAVMFYETPPDQIIPCDNRLFFRFGNTLKEVAQNANGKLSETDTEYALKDIDPAPDRKIIIWEEDLYILPDNIMVGKDIWLRFAKDCPTLLTFPFVNSRTLYYPNGNSASEYCQEASSLEVGMRLRFSWDTSNVFTIKTIESKFDIVEGNSIEVGKLITLDLDVPNYDSVPTNAKADYTIPKNRPILNDLMVGYNHRITFSGHSMAIYNGNYSFSLHDYFKIGQTVIISGSSDAKNNGYAKISDITSSSLIFDKDFVSVQEPEKTIITITPVIPNFSHVLLTENRLFGVDNFKRTFYISALNNPFLFYDSQAANEDSWSVKINGRATGIALWKDNIICFTEDSGFRILGYHALNFGVRQLSLNGIKRGAEKSLVRVGDTLYYFSGKGIMKYSGGSDRKISGEIPIDLNVTSAITDDAFAYMLSNDRIWVYDTELECWWSENAENITELFKFGIQRYLVTEKAIYLAECESDVAVDWSFELPVLNGNNCEKIQPLYAVLNHLENTDSIFTLYLRPFGNFEWKYCGSYSAKNEGSVKIPLPKNYCKGFKIKVSGKGNFYPDSWTVYFKKIK